MHSCDSVNNKQIVPVLPVSSTLPVGARLRPEMLVEYPVVAHSDTQRPHTLLLLSYSQMTLK